jgi:DNA-binding NarL/FixJ family response regulator
MNSVLDRAHTASEPPSLGVIDDRPVIREGLAALARRTESVELRWCVPTVEHALLEQRAHDVGIILLNVDIVTHSFQTVIDRLRRGFCDARIIGVVTEMERWESRVGDRRAVDGQLSVLEPAEVGDWLGSPPVAETMPALPRRAEPPAPEGVRSLTRRESDVLQLLARARSNRAIAMSLGIAEGTVKRHVSSILDKLRAESRAEAAAAARRLGLVA